MSRRSLRLAAGVVLGLLLASGASVVVANGATASVPITVIR